MATKNIWNEENTQKAVDLYTGKIESEMESGKDRASAVSVASSSVFLDEIAKEVGAASNKSVRGKLTSMGVYEKPDRVASVAKTNTLRKEHYVRALANVLELSEEDTDSFKNATMPDLKAVCSKLGLDDIAKMSVKGYTQDGVTTVMKLMEQLGVDFDDLGDRLAEMQDEQAA